MKAGLICTNCEWGVAEATLCRANANTEIDDSIPTFLLFSEIIRV